MKPWRHEDNNVAMSHIVGRGSGSDVVNIGVYAKTIIKWLRYFLG